MLVNFSSTLGTYWIFLGQKKLIDFSPPFNPYFTIRLTSESYNGPLKVLPEGSMVTPVGSQEAPPNHYCQKKISRPKSQIKIPVPWEIVSQACLQKNEWWLHTKVKLYFEERLEEKFPWRHYAVCKVTSSGKPICCLLLDQIAVLLNHFSSPC